MSQITDLQEHGYIYLCETVNKNYVFCRGSDWAIDDKYIFSKYKVIDIYWIDEEKFFIIGGRK